MTKAVGIDLGTTSSRVAVVRDRTPVIIENIEGDGTTPSHVAITASGATIVGKAARRYALKDPTNVFFSIKRLLGRRYDDPLVQELKKFMPYKIIESDSGDAWVMAHGAKYSPVQILSAILLKLAKSAEIYLGEPVVNAVVTVPAYFDAMQRQATKDAARIAGLNVLRIETEPTMAAIAYGIDKQKSQTIAVYDLGEGTFDVSIIEYGDGVFEVKAIAGDNFLGGEDFDIRLVEHIAAGFQRINGIDLTQDAIALQRLKEAAETTKIDLSSQDFSDVDLPFVSTDKTGIKHLKITISRRDLEGLIHDRVERSIDICTLALNDAGVDRTDIDQVVLVGGSTRIPLVERRLSEYFGKKPYGGLRREDAVALGAAISAAVMIGDIKDVLLLDVIPMSFGMRLWVVCSPD